MKYIILLFCLACSPNLRTDTAVGASPPEGVSVEKNTEKLRACNGIEKAICLMKRGEFAKAEQVYKSQLYAFREIVTFSILNRYLLGCPASVIDSMCVKVEVKKISSCFDSYRQWSVDFSTARPKPRTAYGAFGAEIASIIELDDEIAKTMVPLPSGLTFDFKDPKKMKDDKNRFSKWAEFRSAAIRTLVKKLDALQVKTELAEALVNIRKGVLAQSFADELRAVPLPMMLLDGNQLTPSMRHDVKSSYCLATGEKVGELKRVANENFNRSQPLLKVKLTLN